MAPSKLFTFITFCSLICDAVTYDEALIVTRGALTVRFEKGAKTARAGEVIFLAKGTKVGYEAAEDDTEVVYVTYPHWMDVHRQSEHAALLESYHPVSSVVKAQSS